QHGLDHVLVIAGRFGETGERGLHARVVATRPQLGEPLALPLLGVVPDLEDLDLGVFVSAGEGVDADDDPLAGLDLPLLALCAPGDLPLEVALLDPGHDPAE